MITRISLAAGLLASFGCTGDETIAAYGAAGQTWVLTEMSGKAFSAKATLNFGEDGTVSGRAPCNHYSATNTVPYPWFNLSNIAATKVACPDLPLESAFFETMGTMTQSEVLGNILILRDESGTEMVFKTAD